MFFALFIKDFPNRCKAEFTAIVPIRPTINTPLQYVFAVWELAESPSVSVQLTLSLSAYDRTSFSLLNVINNTDTAQCAE